MNSKVRTSYDTIIWLLVFNLHDKLLSFYPTLLFPSYSMRHRQSRKSAKRIESMMKCTGEKNHVKKNRERNHLQICLFSATVLGISPCVIFKCSSKLLYQIDKTFQNHKVARKCTCCYNNFKLAKSTHFFCPNQNQHIWLAL